MADLRDILQEEYEKNLAEIVDPRSLLSLIEEAMDAATALEVLTEKAQTELFNRKQEFSYEAIPAPSVSELGWASLQSNDKGAQAKRTELQQYLENIPGGDLRVKLKNVERLLTDPSYAKQLVNFGDTPGERIASTLAYLVFFKTLTTVITNFNASSAGFNFEAFLAVLLGGSQIPAAGATTIADLMVKGVPISLKLYKEKTVKAGGSYNDLIADLTRRPWMMRYVVATKELTGKNLERSGTILVNSYDLTSDNIVEILYSSAAGENSNLIRLPESVVSGEKKLSFKVPKMPTLDDIEERFYANLQRSIGAEPWFEELKAALNYQENPALFKQKKPGYQNFTVGQGGRAARPSRTSPLLKLLTQFVEEQQLEVNPAELFGLLYQAQDNAADLYWNAVNKANRIGSGLGSYATARRSRDFFNTLGRTQKRKALMLTLGAINYGNQYELRRSDIYGIEGLAAPYKVFPAAQKEVQIGELEIGRENVQELLNAMIDEVNREVFAIFEKLAALQGSLQAYFAGGLQDSKKADEAIETSLDINKQTQEVKQQYSSKE